MRVGAGAYARRAGRVGRSVGFHLGIMGPIGAPGAQGTPTLCAAWLVWRVPVPGLNRQHEADHVVIFCCCRFLLRRMSLLRCRCFLGGASSVRIRPRPGGRAKALPGRARWLQLARPPLYSWDSRTSCQGAIGATVKLALAQSWAQAHTGVQSGLPARRPLRLAPCLRESLRLGFPTAAIGDGSGCGSSSRRGASGVVLSL